MKIGAIGPAVFPLTGWSHTASVCVLMTVASHRKIHLWPLANSHPVSVKTDCRHNRNINESSRRPPGPAGLLFHACG